MLSVSSIIGEMVIQIRRLATVEVNLWMVVVIFHVAFSSFFSIVSLANFRSFCFIYIYSLSTSSDPSIIESKKPANSLHLL